MTENNIYDYCSATPQKQIHLVISLVWYQELNIIFYS